MPAQTACHAESMKITANDYCSCGMFGHIVSSYSVDVEMCSGSLSLRNGPLYALAESRSGEIGAADEKHHRPEIPGGRSAEKMQTGNRRFEAEADLWKPVYLPDLLGKLGG